MKTITVQIPDDVTENYAREKITRLFSDDWMTEWWHISDVRGERSDLTDDQARDVLSMMEHRHDAEIGINWQYIRDIADSMFEEPEDDEQD